MINKTFARYEELKSIIKDAELELKTLQPEILKSVPDDEEVEGNYGVFYVVKLPTYIYSAKHKTMKEDLKECEKEERAKGIAKVHYTPTLFYKRMDEKSA